MSPTFQHHLHIQRASRCKGVTNAIGTAEPVYGFDDVGKIFRNSVVEHIPFHFSVLMNNDVAQAP